MKTEFKREMNRNYMILEPGSSCGETYTLRMLAGNQIGGLLSFQEKNINGETRYYYDITSRQPLGRILEYRNITAVEIRQLVTDILLALRQMEKFLLDENQLCLEPEMVYVEPDSFHCSLCLIPGERRDFTENFLAFSQYLLDHVNHNDEDAVVLAFGLLRESRKGNFGVEDIEKCLRGTEKKSGDAIPVKRRTIITEREDEKPPEPALYEELCSREEEKPEKISIPEKTESTSQKKYHAVMGVCAVFMAALPAGLYAVFGFEGIIMYKWILGAGELLMVFLVLLLLFLEDRPDSGKEAGMGEEEDWEVIFREKEEIIPERKDVPINTKMEPDNEDEEMQTVLLTGKPVFQATRKLVPIEGGEEIPIRYFPFLIGKSKSLADFCLNLPEVSRLHVKIEEDDSGYAVTDLNSTNGTTVGGHLLETNETYPLPIGTELAIASKRFRFL